MAPSLQYTTTCYPPEQVRQAERLLPVPPIDPSRAVGKCTGLSLAQVIAAKRLLPKPSRRVVLLEFDYGTFPAGWAGIPDPSPPLPKWVVVEEFAAPFKGLKGVRVEHSVGLEGPPGSVPVWTLEENLPRHSLGVEILTNEDQVTIRHVGRELIREAKRSAPWWKE